MIKAEILEALPKLTAEERREIRAKLNELDNEAWFDDGELSEQEKAIIERAWTSTTEIHSGVFRRSRRILLPEPASLTNL